MCPHSSDKPTFLTGHKNHRLTHPGASAVLAPQVRQEKSPKKIHTRCAQRNPAMLFRLVLLALLPLSLATPNLVAPFDAPYIEAPLTLDNSTSPASPHELIKRQSTSCPNGYTSCGSLGQEAAAVCCANNQICTPDAALHVACCPRGAVCTGTIGAQTYNPMTVTSTSTSSQPLITTPAVLTTTAGGGGGFIIASSGTVAILPGAAGRLRQPVSSPRQPPSLVPV